MNSPSNSHILTQEDLKSRQLPHKLTAIHNSPFDCDANTQTCNSSLTYQLGRIGQWQLPSEAHGRFTDPHWLRHQPTHPHISFQSSTSCAQTFWCLERKLKCPRNCFYYQRTAHRKDCDAWHAMVQVCGLHLARSIYCVWRCLYKSASCRAHVVGFKH